LSDLLRRLPLHPPGPRAESFRNASSLRRKLGDFADPDPGYAGTGTKGGQGVHLVWAQFADHPEALSAAVTRMTASADGLTVVLPPEDGEATAVEGRIVFREHRARERDPGLVRAKYRSESSSQASPTARSATASSSATTPSRLARVRPPKGHENAMERASGA
jgi:5-methylcytosine-specific restriction protein A